MDEKRRPESDPDDPLSPIFGTAAELEALLKRKVEAALADPRPAIPAEEAFARMRQYIADRKARERAAR